MAVHPRRGKLARLRRLSRGVKRRAQARPRGPPQAHRGAAAPRSVDVAADGRKRRREREREEEPGAKALAATTREPRTLSARASPAPAAVTRALSDTFAALAGARRAAGRCKADQALLLAGAAAAASRRLQSAVAAAGRPLAASCADEALETRSQHDAAWRKLTALKARIAAHDAEAVLEALLAMDAAYHSLRYVAVLVGGAAESAVPAASIFFSDGCAWAPGGAADDSLLLEFIERDAGQGGVAAARSLLDLPHAGGVEAPQDNPLLALLHARWRESVVRLAKAGLVPAFIKDCVPAQVPLDVRSVTAKGSDPLAGEAVRKWRDAVRVWACHAYAYAVPNEAALKALKEESPLVEVGAGTGYWAALLRNRGAQIFAYDLAPPSAERRDWGVDVNEYHGRCHAWTDVQQGGVEVASMHKGAALFFCYPPPDSDAALQALRAFEGSVVCHVGEWQGDTGTDAFERELMHNFKLQKTVPLPNWGDSSAELTVWRRSIAGEGDGLPPLACWGCDRRDVPLWRCRLSYDAVFCSADCAHGPLAAARHRAVLTLKMAVLPRDSLGLPQFGDSRYFRCVTI